MAGPEVGSVYIRVKTLTDRVAPEIQKALSSVNTGSINTAGTQIGKQFSSAIGKGLDQNIFNKIGDSLEAFGGAAGTTRHELYTLTKTAYTAGTSIATLIGAVSALIGGLAGLAGAALGAVPAVMGLVGAFLALKAGMAVGQFAFSGISDAVNKAIQQQQQLGLTLAQTQKRWQDLAFAVEDAEHAEKRAALDLEKARNSLIRTQDMPASSMARREALQQYADAELTLRKAKAKVKDALAEQKNPNVFKTPSAGSDPYAGLTATQKDFAKWLVSIQGMLKDLKEIAAKGFLPILKTNLQNIIKAVLPTFKKGLGEIATGLGGLTTNLTKAITDPGNVKLLGTVMHNIASDLPIIGTIIGNVYGIFLKILEKSHPLVTEFLNFLKTKTDGLVKYLNAPAAQKDIDNFFHNASITMGKLGTLFENTFGFIGVLVRNNFGPGSGGQLMLDWLTRVTGGWATLDSTVEKKQALKDYFVDTAHNSIAVLDAIGALAKEFLKLGQNPAIAKTFEAMADPEAVKAMGELGKKFVDAGPSLGRLVADVTIFINKLTDSKAIENFFNTIDLMIKGVNKALENPALDKFLTIMGQVHGVVFGVTAGAHVLGKGFDYVGETVDMIGKTLKPVNTAIKETKTAFEIVDGISFSKIKDAFDVSSWGDFKNKYLGVTGEIKLQTGQMKKSIDQAFAEMTYSTNPYVKALGRIGSTPKEISDAFKNADLGGAIKALDLKALRDAFKFGSETGDAGAPIGAGLLGGLKNFKTALTGQLGSIKGAMTGAFTTMTESGNLFVQTLGKLGMTLMTNPWVLAIAAIIAIMVILYNTSADFRKKVDEAFSAVGKMLDTAFKSIQEAFEPVIDAWNELMETLGLNNTTGSNPLIGFFMWLVDVFKLLLAAIIPVVSYLVGAFANTLKFVITLFSGIIKIIKGVITIVVEFFKALFTGKWDAFAKAADKAFKDIKNGAMQILAGIVNFFIDGINNVINMANDIAKNIKAATGGAISFAIIPKVARWVPPKFADGGIVMPSNGGSLINVAEAGRPERVEPLDPDGLSRRDKAMIEFLTKGSSGVRPIQLNVYPSAGMDEKDLAAVVSRQLAFELRRGGV